MVHVQGAGFFGMSLDGTFLTLLLTLLVPNLPDSCSITDLGSTHVLDDDLTVGIRMVA